MLFQVYLISIIVYAAALLLALILFLDYFKRNYGLNSKLDIEPFTRITVFKLLAISTLPIVRTIALFILIFQRDQLIRDTNNYEEER